MNSNKTKSILLDKADYLAHLVYKYSKQFPAKELFGLTSQLRRAALSVPLNIIEGYGRYQSKEFRRFLEIAYGSLQETKYLLDFSVKEHYLAEKDYKKIFAVADEVGKMLWSSIKTIRGKKS